MAHRRYGFVSGIRRSIATGGSAKLLSRRDAMEATLLAMSVLAVYGRCRWTRSTVLVIAHNVALTESIGI